MQTIDTRHARRAPASAPCLPSPALVVMIFAEARIYTQLDSAAPRAAQRSLKAQETLFKECSTAQYDEENSLHAFVRPGGENFQAGSAQLE